MSFLRQYGIIVDEKAGILKSSCHAGERDLVVDAILKEYFRTGTMPAADLQTYTDLAMAYVQEFEEDKYGEDQLREIISSGAERTLNIKDCFAYRFSFNLAGGDQSLEFDGETYPAILTLFVEYRHYVSRKDGTERISSSEYFENSPIRYRTIYKTDISDGFQVEQRIRKVYPASSSSNEVFEVPTVLWAEIGDITAPKSVEWRNGKPFGRREKLRIISPLQARKILADHFSLFGEYAYSLSRPESVMTGLYREIPTDTFGPKFGTPVAWPQTAWYKALLAGAQTQEAADNILRTECCMSPSSAALKKLVEVSQNCQPQK